MYHIEMDSQNSEELNNIQIVVNGELTFEDKMCAVATLLRALFKDENIPKAMFALSMFMPVFLHSSAKIDVGELQRQMGEEDAADK